MIAVLQKFAEGNANPEARIMSGQDQTTRGSVAMRASWQMLQMVGCLASRLSILEDWQDLSMPVYMLII